MLKDSYSNERVKVSASSGVPYLTTLHVRVFAIVMEPRGGVSLIVTRSNMSAAFEAAVMGGVRHKHSMQEAVSSLPLL